MQTFFHIKIEFCYNLRKVLQHKTELYTKKNTVRNGKTMNIKKYTLLTLIIALTATLISNPRNDDDERNPFRSGYNPYRYGCDSGETMQECIYRHQREYRELQLHKERASQEEEQLEHIQKKNVFIVGSLIAASYFIASYFWKKPTPPSEEKKRTPEINGADYEALVIEMNKSHTDDHPEAAESAEAAESPQQE